MNTAIEQIEAGVKAHLQGNLKAAESAYLAALSLDGRNATAHNNLGFVYGQEERWDEALLHLRTALDLNPDMSMAHSNIGQILFSTGQAQQGLDHLEKAIALNPDNTQAWDNLARVCLHCGNYQRAEYAWLRALKQQGGDARLMVRLGTAIAAQGGLDEAIDIYRQVVAANGRFADAWAQMGVCLFLRKDLGSARDALQNALALRADDLITLRHLALVYLALGDKVRAEQFFVRLTKQCGEDNESQLDLAVLRLSMGKAEIALTQLTDLFERKPDDERVRFYLAMALRECGDAEQSQSLFRQISEAGGAYAARAGTTLS